MASEQCQVESLQQTENPNEKMVSSFGDQSQTEVSPHEIDEAVGVNNLYTNRIEKLMGENKRKDEELFNLAAELAQVKEENKRKDEEHFNLAAELAQVKEELEQKKSEPDPTMVRVQRNANRTLVAKLSNMTKEMGELKQALHESDEKNAHLESMLSESESAHGLRKKCDDLTVQINKLYVKMNSVQTAAEEEIKLLKQMQDSEIEEYMKEAERMARKKCALDAKYAQAQASVKRTEAKLKVVSAKNIALEQKAQKSMDKINALTLQLNEIIESQDQLEIVNAENIEFVKEAANERICNNVLRDLYAKADRMARALGAQLAETQLVRKAIQAELEDVRAENIALKEKNDKNSNILNDILAQTEKLLLGAEEELRLAHQKGICGSETLVT